MRFNLSKLKVDCEKELAKALPEIGHFYSQLKYRYDPALFGRIPQANQKLGFCDVDAYGLRSHPNFSASSSPSVLVVGDSVTFGVGITDPKNLMTYRLQSLLNCNVINLSYRAFRIEQQLLSLTRFCARMNSPRVKHVVLWGGYCDLLWWLLNSGCQLGHFGIPKHWLESAASGTSEILRKIFSDSFIRKLEDIWTSGRASAKTWQQTYWIPCPISELISAIIVQIEAISAFTNSFGADFLFVLQPILLEPDRSKSSATITYCKSRSSAIRAGIGKGTKGFEDFAFEFRQIIIDELVKHKISFLDAQNVVQPEEFFDQVHLNPDAHSKLAQTLAAQLEKSKLSYAS